MDNFSKEYSNDAAKKKVIVVKSNEFFPVKKINFRQTEQLEGLAPSNVSSISKVYKTPSKSTSIETNASFQRSILKQPPENLVQKNQTAPIRKYKRKVSIVDQGKEKTKLVDFASLSVATNYAERSLIQKTAETETVNVENDLNEEKVIDLVNEKYGDAIESEISYVPENKITHNKTTSNSESTPKFQRGIKIIRDSPLELPSNIYEYKLREELFIDQINLEQGTEDEIKEVQEYLESIIILDSPESEKGYKLFTREQLKKLPDKIFESPPEIPVKKEISPEQDNLSDLNEANLNQLLNSHINDIQTQVITSNDFNNFESGTAKEAADQVKMLELDLKDLDFDVLTEPTNTGNISSYVDQKKSPSEFETNGKEIVIADEDAFVLKEMDKFIEEIKAKNRCENSNEKFSDVLENKENLNNLERTDINQNSLRAERPNAGILESTNIETFKYLEIDKVLNNTNETQTYNENDTQKTNENNTTPQVIERGNLGKLSVEPEIQRETESTPSFNVAATVNDNKANDSTENSSSNKIYDRHNSNEYTLLIIKEDGTLQQISIDNVAPSVEPHISSVQAADSQFIQTENSAPEKCVSNERNNPQINKEEFLALIERARAVRYDPNADVGKAESLKQFNGSLREHVKVLKEIYEKLEVITELTAEKLNKNLGEEEICGLRHDLNFVKSIVESTFANEEKKKIKYKVVSVTKKNATETKIKSPKKPVTKKVGRKSTSRFNKKYPNKLLRKTLYRMNKILNIFERNRVLVNNVRQNAFVSKLKEIAKNDLKNKQMQEKTNEKESKNTIIDKVKPKRKVLGSETNEIVNGNDNDSNASNRTNSKKSYYDVLGINKKSVVTVVLNKSNITEEDIENFNQSLPQEELSTSLCLYNFDKDDENADEIKESSNLTTADAECDTKTKDEETNSDDTEGNLSVQFKDGKEMTSTNEDTTSRYALRPRITKKNYSSNWFRVDTFLSDMEKPLSYELDYSNVMSMPDKNRSRKYDYVLRNDNHPCVVLYDKKPEVNKLIFEKSTTQSPRKSLGTQNIKKGDKIDDETNNVTNRYETRSKTVEKKLVEPQRILRNRKV